jgi:hypothetical protein
MCRYHVGMSTHDDSFAALGRRYTRSIGHARKLSAALAKAGHVRSKQLNAYHCTKGFAVTADRLGRHVIVTHRTGEQTWLSEKERAQHVAALAALVPDIEKAGFTIVETAPYHLHVVPKGEG